MDVRHESVVVRRRVKSFRAESECQRRSWQKSIRCRLAQVAPRTIHSLTGWRCVLPLHHKCQSVGGYRMNLDRSCITRVRFLSSSFTLPRSTPPENKSTQHRIVLHPCRASLNHIPPYLLECCWCHCCWSVSRASGCTMSHISDSIIANSTKWPKGRKRRFVKAFILSLAHSVLFPILSYLQP